MHRWWRNPWVIAWASTVALIASSGSINIFTTSVFLKPITADLGIGRAVFGSAMLLSTVIGALTAPLVGYLVARYGARRVMLPGIALFSAVTAAQSQLTASFFNIYTLATMRGLVHNGQSPVSYSMVLAKWFDKRRGLAIGLAMAGSGIGAAFLPPAVGYLVATLGWRTAYIALGAIIFVLAGLPVLLFVREPAEGEGVAKPSEQGELPGTSVREALTGSWKFWGLAAAFLFGVVAFNGLLTQFVAIMTDRGFSLTAAAGILAVSGITSALGRVSAGYLADRFFAPYVAVATYIPAMLGIALFSTGGGGSIPYLTAALLGFSLGSEISLIPFFASRYFGLKSYGPIFGGLFGIFSGSTGIGAFVSGMSFDVYHSYVPAFMLYEGLLVAACVVFLCLGAYAYPAQRNAVA